MHPPFKKNPLPSIVGWSVAFVCLAPAFLQRWGWDFSASIQLAGDLHSTDEVFQSLHGAFVHTLLEWTGVCFACITVLQSLAYFSVKRDALIPAISLMFFFSAFMDTFHILAADRLIFSIADPKDFIPFTWAVCRLLNAVFFSLALTVATSSLRENVRHFDLRSILITFFVILSFVISITFISANAVNLPQTTFPSKILTRPYDVLPILIYLYCAFQSFKFYQSSPNAFTFALFLSVFPSIGTQFHMAFGSSGLFDSHFNIGHFLKVCSYIVPMVGFIFLSKEVHAEEVNSNERFTKVVESVPAGITVVGVGGAINLVNKKMCEMFGYEPHELMGRRLQNLVSIQVHKKDFLLEEVNRDIEPREGQELHGVKKNNDIIPIEIALSPINTLDNSDEYVAIISDTSARKKMEELQKKSALELEKRNRKLERFNDVAVDRELRMIELKKEINSYAERVGETPPYRILQKTLEDVSE